MYTEKSLNVISGLQMNNQIAVHDFIVLFYQTTDMTLVISMHPS